MDNWQKVEVIAQIASAAGTLGAVMVALWLSRAQSRPKLRVTASIGHLVQQGGQRSPERIVRFSIANASFRDVTIESFGWTIGLVRKAHFWQSLSDHPMSSTLPKKLAPSERATFVFNWDSYSDRSIKMTAEFGTSQVIRRLRAYRMRASVHLSTGEYLTYPVSRELAKALLEVSSGTT